MADKKKLSLKAEKRKVLGRKVKKLRQEGNLPANIFGKKVKSLAIQLSDKDLKESFKQAGETKVIDLQVKGESKTRPVLISNLQTHPLSDDFLHVDFHQVDLKEKVTATVPVEFVGEAPAVKEKIGILLMLLNEVEVEALPTELPDKLTLSLDGLKTLEDQLTVADFKVPTGVTLLVEKSEIVAKIEPPKTEGEEAPAPVESEASEGVESEAVEGEAPAEGEQKPAGEDQKGQAEGGKKEEKPREQNPKK